MRQLDDGVELNRELSATLLVRTSPWLAHPNVLNNSWTVGLELCFFR